MKLIVEVVPSPDNDDMAITTFRTRGRAENMVVLRLINRLMRALGNEYSTINAESDNIKSMLKYRYLKE